MDTLLAIFVLGAVIFFGALISVGNERQRKALDGIREQTALWAIQDLRLKREKLAREVRVDDPVAWLNQTVTKVYGENLGLTVTQVFDKPQALICTANDGRAVMFSPISPEEVGRLKWAKNNRLTRQNNPALIRVKGVKCFEISILNGGLLFDLELGLAWERLMGVSSAKVERLWMYLI